MYRTANIFGPMHPSHYMPFPFPKLSDSKDEYEKSVSERKAEMCHRSTGTLRISHNCINFRKKDKTD